MHSETPVVSVIRRSSRLMVRELGFMGSTLASTNYSPSAVHTLVEIALRKEMTASQLVQLLGLEKSSVSRMLARLIAAGELEEVISTEDARAKSLRLTAKGHETVSKINTFSNERVVTAIKRLAPAQQQTISEGLSLYANALLACREAGNDMQPDELKIVQGYIPGMIGRIAEMHGSYYSREHNFGRFFEAKVASGLAEFSERLEKPCNLKKAPFGAALVSEHFFIRSHRHFCIHARCNVRVCVSPGLSGFLGFKLSNDRGAGETGSTRIVAVYCRHGASGQ